MDFYRLKQPGSEWFSRQGDVIKASKAAGVDWEKVEVPDSKPERLAWLNAHARGGSNPLAIQPDETDNEPLPVPIAAKDNVACPKCKWTPRMCEGFTERVHLSATVDGLKRWIEQQDGWALSTIVEAITYRLIDLARIATGKKPQ